LSHTLDIFVLVRDTTPTRHPKVHASLPCQANPRPYSTSPPCSSTWFTSGILSFVPPQNKLISISAQRRVFGSRGGPRLPAGRDVGGLAEGPLLDEEGGEERDGDDRHTGQEHRVEGVGQAMADAQLHRRRQVRELRWIEHCGGGCSPAGGFQLGPHGRRK